MCSIPTPPPPSRIIIYGTILLCGFLSVVSLSAPADDAIAYRFTNPKMLHATISSPQKNLPFNAHTRHHQKSRTHLHHRWRRNCQTFFLLLLWILTNCTKNFLVPFSSCVSKTETVNTFCQKQKQKNSHKIPKKLQENSRLWSIEKRDLSGAAREHFLRGGSSRSHDSCSAKSISAKSLSSRKGEMNDPHEELSPRHATLC
jgi:hypothetical protein